MRAMVIVISVALLGAGVIGCCDCQQHLVEKDARIGELEKQVAELESKLSEQPAAEQPQAEQPSATAPASPTDLAACIERLKACELDPFKGGKYFSPEKVDPSCDKPTAKAGPKDLKNPFEGKPKAKAAEGELVDPFSKK